MNKNSSIIKEQVLIPLYTKLLNNDIVQVRSENTVELMNKTLTFTSEESGLIDIDGIFVTSPDYVNAEFKWYDSMEPHITQISNHAKMWGMVCDDNGMVNSNYGYLIGSPQNGYQYKNVLKQLQLDPMSRRAVMYYANPMIHYTGGKDHVCTVYVSYTMRDNKLHAFVSMRSSDIRFGIIGADLAWQIRTLKRLATDLGCKAGDVHWHAVSLHLYERHFNQLEEICDEA